MQHRPLVARRDATFARLFVPVLPLLLLPVLVATCSSEPVVFEPPSDHPASPDAAEAPLPTPSTTLAIARPLGSGEPTAAPTSTPTSEPTTAPADADATYVCPMHPEVVSNAPGRCPKCNMPLKRRAPPPLPEGDAR